jgi:hypothetical protein
VDYIKNFFKYVVEVSFSGEKFLTPSLFLSKLFLVRYGYFEGNFENSQTYAYVLIFLRMLSKLISYLSEHKHKKLKFMLGCTRRCTLEELLLSMYIVHVNITKL